MRLKITGQIKQAARRHSGANGTANIARRSHDLDMPAALMETRIQFRARIA
ncbi:hypothetical protein GCM10011400_02230 [Paraburkholderia caffeinilytica]|uniref:Uncharacterized protein n=1 Tax=Paraburkholderia caffeinilytica TaxID=1761016 RepID=A0ABQ1L6Y8_9BURK|nr:hypothetical protein GCM10011400_02230 [Paraburkholderia caffeinilytica]